MTSLADYTAAHRIAYDELTSVIASLSDDQLAAQSLCPDWDIRACVAHAVGIDKALTGWVPDPEDLFDFGIAAQFMEEAASMSPAEFISAVAAIADARVADLESLDPSVVDEPSMT
ncbi:MAG: maleylpyruvate isomerase N-terminal domain-containing protein, partial [Actinomycetota bacterium]|nr:maleylpyruvate isomerase N-terminal domain-containing protein [Actinomycetota bacterium]